MEKNKKVFIKASNYWAIHDLALFGNWNRVRGTKLQALYYLVQHKGKVLEGPHDSRYKGIKVLEYGNGRYIGFIRTTNNTDTFSPCKLHVVSLQELKKMNGQGIGTDVVRPIIEGVFGNRSYHTTEIEPKI